MAYKVVLENEANFHSWATWVALELERAGLGNYLQKEIHLHPLPLWENGERSTKRLLWDIRDNLARNVILHSMNDDLFCQFESYESAREIWRHVLFRYGDSYVGEARKLLLELHKCLHRQECLVQCRDFHYKDMSEQEQWHVVKDMLDKFPSHWIEYPMGFTHLTESIAEQVDRLEMEKYDLVYDMMDRLKEDPPTFMFPNLESICKQGKEQTTKPTRQSKRNVVPLQVYQRKRFKKQKGTVGNNTVRVD